MASWGTGDYLGGLTSGLGGAAGIAALSTGPIGWGALAGGAAIGLLSGHKSASAKKKRRMAESQARRSIDEKRRKALFEKHQARQQEAGLASSRSPRRRRRQNMEQAGLSTDGLLAQQDQMMHGPGWNPGRS